MRDGTETNSIRWKAYQLDRRLRTWMFAVAWWISAGATVAWAQPTRSANDDVEAVKESEIPTHFVEGLSVVQQEPAGAHIRFELRGSIRLTSSSGVWERIPLYLGRCALVKTEMTGDGQHAIRVAEDGTGYELWVSGQPNSKHNFVLTFARKLLRLGRTRRLQLQLPQRTVPIHLWLDEVDPRIELNDKQTIIEAAKPGPKAGTWKLDLVSLGGDFRIQWQPSDKPMAVDEGGLTAVGEVEYRFLDPRQIDASARIAVTSSRGTLSAFSLRLPPGFSLLESEAPDFGIAVVERGTARRGSLIRIDIFERAVSTAEVFVEARLTRPFNRATELAGFAVENATFQSNRLSVRFPTQYSLRTPVMLNARRVDRDSEGDLAREGEAHFDLFHQTSEATSLLAELKDRQSRILVQPVYRLTVEATRVVLDVTMRFDIRGTIPKELDIWTGDWKLTLAETPVAPSLELAEPDATVQLVPLERTDLAAEPFDVRLRGEMSLANLPSLVRLSLPNLRPDVPVQGQAIVVSPPRLILVVASGLDAVPQLEDQAYSFDVAPQEWGLSEEVLLEGGRTSFFQFETSATLSLTLGISERKQSFVGSMDTAIAVSGTAVNVSQSLDFQVLNQPLASLPLMIPATALSLELTAGGQVLDLTDSPPIGGTEQWIARTISLPGPPRFGRLQVIATYQLRGVPRNKETTTRSIPLIHWQADDKWEQFQNKVSIRDALSREINLTLSAWSPVFGSSPELLEATATEYLPNVSVELTSSAAPTRRADITKTWVRTIFSGAKRVDHLSARLRTIDRVLTVKLPEGSELLLVAVDGHRVDNVNSVEQLVEIPIVVAESGEEVLLEFWYQFTNQDLNGSIELEFAEVLEARGIGRTYWELVTNRDRHLLLPPTSCFSENEWVPGEWGWSRRPQLSTAELRQWIDVTGIEPELTGANRYLFSSIDQLGVVRLQICDRTTLVLFASLVALVMGIAVAYCQPARHPLAMAAVGIIVMSLVVRFPSTGFLVIQSAFVGAILVALCLVLRWRYFPLATRILGATEDDHLPIEVDMTTRSLELSRLADDSGSQSMAGSQS
ncbi:MAG TPA: hypothetical protein EYQ75_23990 [Planctomycetaceae bacterium]|nr:hypothetical protein [Planctomycetaceae bacterium]